MGVTIDELAAIARTSTATVSRALNGKPGVTEATRQRIVALAEKLGYRANPMARNLALQKSHVLGMIGADLLNPMYIQFFRDVHQRAETLGYQVLLADSERDAGKEQHNIDTMLLHRAEGFLIFPVGDWQRNAPLDHLKRLRLHRIPFVVMGKVAGLDCDWVTSDEVDAAFISTRHLLALGHRRIGFIGQDTQNRCVAERMEGVASALAVDGLALDPAHVVPLKPGWVDCMTAMLRAPGRPTALVFVNDVLAMEALRPLRALGLNLPGDLSITTFDDSQWSRHMEPALTTAAENETQVKELAMDLLLRRIADPDTPTVQHLVPRKFILRESAAPAPQGV